MTSNNTHSPADTHKHPSAASRESSCSHSLQRRRRADRSPNYTPSPNYPIIKTLAVSHHINWVPPLCQFVWSQRATGVFFWFILGQHELTYWIGTGEAQRRSELLKRIKGSQSLMPHIKNLKWVFFSCTLARKRRFSDFSSYLTSLSHLNWKSV